MRRLFVVLMIISVTHGDDCDHTWSQFTNKEDLLAHGIDAGEFKPKVHSYVGRFATPKGLQPGRIQVSPSSVDVFLTSSGKVKKFSENFEFLRGNKNLTYAWVKIGSQKCLPTAVTVDERWLIGRTSHDDSSYLGKVRVGSLGLLYEDHFGHEILTDDYEVLTCNANPLRKVVEDTKTENSNLKNEFHVLNQKLMEKSSKLANCEASEAILMQNLQNLTAENEILSSGKETLVISINKLKSDVDNLKENSLRTENQLNNKIKMLEIERDLLKRQVQEKMDENQKMRFELEEFAEKHENLSEEIENLNRRIENAASEHALEVEKLEKKIQMLEDKPDELNHDSEVSEHCEHNSESDQLEMELKIFNFYMIEMKYFIGFMARNDENAAKEILAKLNKIFENEATIDCELSADERICEANSWTNRHFNTKITGISFSEVKNQEISNSNSFSSFNFPPPGFNFNKVEDINLDDQKMSLKITEIVIKDQISWFMAQHLGKTFPNLLTLSIVNSHFLKFQKYDFEDMENLKTLKITENQVDNVPKGVFINLPSLAELDLSFNHISVIDDEAFKELPTLQSLFLNNNQLKEITEITFSEHLVKLSLSHNNLMHLSGSFIERLRKIEVVDLRSNECIDVMINESTAEDDVTTMMMKCVKM